jgi:hypothetical protein
MTGAIAYAARINPQSAADPAKAPRVTIPSTF